MSSLAVPSLLTVAGLSLPYLGLFHFLSLPRTLPFALPEPLLSLASLVIVSCVVFSFGKPLLVSLTVPRTRPQEADGVDWIASNVIGATFVGMWVWVLKQKWPCPEGKVAFDHETRVTEVIGYTASALVIAIAVLNCTSPGPCHDVRGGGRKGKA